MNARDRRDEIVQFVMMKKQTTIKEISKEFDVSIRTVKYDIMYLSQRHPIYTVQGHYGGVLWLGERVQYENLLTKTQQNTLLEIYEESSGRRKLILAQILRKFAVGSWGG